MNLTLEQFRDSWIAYPGVRKTIEHRDYGKLTADVIFRDGFFQVEEVIMFPNAFIAAHRHPNITAYELYVSGDVVIAVHEDAERVNRFLRRVSPLCERRLAGRLFKVRSTDWHGAKAGPNGAVFQSVQMWSGAVPVTAAGVDWEGPPL